MSAQKKVELDTSFRNKKGTETLQVTGRENHIIITYHRFSDGLHGEVGYG